MTNIQQGFQPEIRLFSPISLLIQALVPVIPVRKLSSFQRYLHPAGSFQPVIDFTGHFLNFFLMLRAGDQAVAYKKEVSEQIDREIAALQELLNKKLPEINRRMEQQNIEMLPTPKKGEVEL